MQTLELATWREYHTTLQNLENERRSRITKSGVKFNQMLFRGIADSKWGLETTLERFEKIERCDQVFGVLDFYRKTWTCKRAVESFVDRTWDIPLPADFEALVQNDPYGWMDCILMQQPTLVEYWIYLRHHGFPSPLLDWTASPYVAAFFAFSDPAGKSGRVGVYVLLQDTVHGGSSDAHLFTLDPYTRSHPRHFFQQCRYSMCVGTDLSTQSYSFRPHDSGLRDAAGVQGELIAITIPSAERVTALRDLDLMNINEFSLFGSPDGLVKTLARRELLLRDSN